MTSTKKTTSSWSARLPALALAAAKGTAPETDLVFILQDAGKKAAPPKGAYGTLVEKFRKGTAFVARSGSLQFVRFSGKSDAENVLFVGVGAAAEITEEKLRVAGGNAWAKISAEKTASVLIHAEGLTQQQLVAFLEGVMLASYNFPAPKQSKAAETGERVQIQVASSDKAHRSQLQDEIERIQYTAEAMTITRDWSNQPSNIGTPEYYAQEAQVLAKELGLKCTILDERAAAREGMALYLSVGQGSEREGRIVVLEHTPKATKGVKTVALVGKGITFDSGGISIKPSMRMEEMKHDMTGAATVMGAMYLAAKTGVSNRVVGIMAFNENMPDAMAIQPGNVVTARNGKTVEIINTDAEGRLILADALDYAHDFKPDAIIDIATLTGAVVVALGKYACGMLGNNETLIDAVKRAADASGEKVWQLPLFDEYFDDMKSEWADMKNSCNDGNGGTIRGAIFLKQFIKKDMPWVHLDIAGTGYNVSHLSYLPKRGASGQYVRTLARFAADF